MLPEIAARLCGIYGQQGLVQFDRDVCVTIRLVVDMGWQSDISSSVTPVVMDFRFSWSCRAWWAPLISRESGWLGKTILSDPCFSGVDRLMKGGSAAPQLTIYISVMLADPDWLTIQCDWGSSDGSSSWISAWLNLFFFFSGSRLFPSPHSEHMHAQWSGACVWRGLEK